MRYIRKVAPNCPADLFMDLYKDNGKPPDTVTLSKNAINFFKNEADLIVVHGRYIKFSWDEDEKFPELRLRVVKKGSDYQLLWLNEKKSFNYSSNSPNNDKKSSIYIDKDEER